MTTKNYVSSIKYQVSSITGRLSKGTKKYLIPDTEYRIPRRERGDTLIEVIIGTVIIGMVLLSAFTLSNRAFQLGLSSRERSQAAQLMQTQAEGLRALRDNRNWSDFVDLLPASGNDFHVFRDGAGHWQVGNARLNNPSLNGQESIFSQVWVNGRLTGPDPSQPDKFEGTVHVEWPRIGGGTETSMLAIKLTDRAIPLANLTLNPAQTPEANFTGNPRSGAGSADVDFQDLSTNNPDSWQWDFGDGGSSTVQNPSHTYTSPGTYDVTLTVSGLGGTDSTTKRDYITVYQSVNADFRGSPRSGSWPLRVRFNDLSAGDIDSWQWNFGDGSSSSRRNPSHTYSNPGTYTVTLDVSGPGGSDRERKRNYIEVEECGLVYGSQMKPRPGHNHVNGNVRRFVHNFDYATHSCRQRHRKLQIRARAQLYNGGPTMHVYRNGREIFRRQLNHTNWRVYTLNIGNTNRSDVTIRMSGDAWEGPGGRDRNFMVHYLRYVR